MDQLSLIRLRSKFTSRVSEHSIIKGLPYTLSSYFITKPAPFHYCIMGVQGVEVLEVLCVLVHVSPVDM